MKKTLLILLLTLWATLVQGAHITDKLLVGIYGKPDATTEPLKVLTSGTPVEILEKKNGFSKVRLGDDTVGWMETNYITSEKPAKVKLLELQAKTGSLQQQLREAEKELKQLRSSQATAPAPTDTESPKALTEAKAQIEQLTGELAAAKVALEQARQESGTQDSLLEAENRVLKERISKAATALRNELPTGPPPTPTNGYRFSAWHLAVLVVIILVSFISGIAYKNYGISRRYGGFKI
ncbi:TIGR04211 family SH3 domain-containing protein [Solemya velesiana gill symbiont]|uniref:SH3b domain-containing protein n=1 Tax=Solemya velesiana gill symbiont TaxID=1918948 RepID=A0A1T2KV36_9GAMM|nr:TIGR04211 family SH3 domain-containing protein [Solemya velesiana gill symbiont]OOZ36586.1 hypothetical protein BOW51_06460 [Solemya velesiana gill symbiont]